MPLFDFICADGHITERLRPASVHEVVCPQCGAPAQRGEVNLVSMQMGADANWSPLVRDGGRIRTSVNERPIHLRQWREATEQLAYEHERAEESAQRKLPSPPLADIAIKRARAMQKAGINDSLDMPKLSK